MEIRSVSAGPRFYWGPNSSITPSSPPAPTPPSTEGSGFRKAQSSLFRVIVGRGLPVRRSPWRSRVDPCRWSHQFAEPSSVDGGVGAVGDDGVGNYTEAVAVSA